jgi:hypothetical protein
MKKLFPICFATLLVLAMTCTKAHFAPGPDGSVAGGAIAGSGGTGGTGGTLGTGGSEIGGMGGATCQLTPQDCSKPAGEILTPPCDPVCQRGTCPCGQKCTYAGTDPQPVCADQGALKESESCTVKNSGGSEQSDDCEAGNICLAPVSEKDAYCFKLCYQDFDCKSYGDCSERLLSPKGGSVSVCSPAHKLCGSSDSPCCDPLSTVNSVCPSANPICFLVAPDTQAATDATRHSRTVCEYSPGGIVENSTTSCSSSRECMASLTCVDDDHICHRVCDPANPVCATNMHCKSWGIEYGYCIAD